MVTGVGAAGCAGGADAAGADAAGSGDAPAPGAAGAPAPAGGATGVFTPTTIALMAATSSIEPIVETGMFDESEVIWPDGKVMLFAASTPVTWAGVTLFAASLAGSSVIVIRCSSPPVRSTVATPSRPWMAG